MVRRIILVITMAFAVANVSAQDLRFKLDGELVHSGSVESRICPKDKYGNQCAKIELSIPLEGITITGENIEGKVTYSNGVYSFFVSTRNNKKIFISAEGFKRFDMMLEDLKMREAYTARLVVPQDRNAGKAYVTFESDELDNYIILIDGKEYEAQGNGQILVQLPYGTYDYVAKAKDREDKKATIILTGKPITENVNFEMIKADVNVETDGNSTLIIDGEIFQSENIKLSTGMHSFTTQIHDSTYTRFIDIPSKGASVEMKMLGTLDISSKDGAKVIISPIGQSVIPIGENIIPNEEQNAVMGITDGSPMVRTGKNIDGLLGRYRIFTYRKGYKPKYAIVDVPVRAEQELDMPLKRDINEMRFITYDASISQPFGLRLGYVGRWGAYIGFRLSLLNVAQWGASETSPSSVENASLADRLKYYMTEGEIPEGAEDKGPWRWQITAGLMFSVNRWFYLYAGGGYGEDKQVYEKEKFLYTDKFYRCGVAEGGAMLRFGSFLLGGGCSWMIAKGHLKVEPSLSVGFTFGKKYVKNPFE